MTATCWKIWTLKSWSFNVLQLEKKKLNLAEITEVQLDLGQSFLKSADHHRLVTCGRKQAERCFILSDSVFWSFSLI